MPKTTQPCISLLKQVKFFFLPFLTCHPRRKVCVLKRVSYKELKKATNNFRRMIAYDSEATTYEAIFSDGSVFVVKEMGNDEEGNEVFFRQIQLLSRLYHRHIVALQGYSIGHRRFLLFESTARGSLRQHLNDPLKTPLSWKIRVQIALGVASALVHLQFFCDPPVYRVSVDSNNIILDDKLAPKLTNIGHVSSPEYHIEHQEMPQERADMLLQFGTLILELVTGQSSENGNAGVIDWIQERTSNINMDNMIDPDLGNGYDTHELKTLLNLARICLKTERKRWFSILHVSWYLQATFGDHTCLSI